MALIQCLECGRNVSDMATACPDCGYPIKKLRSSGSVVIKLDLSVGDASASKHKLFNAQTGALLWEGRNGQTAQFHIDKPTTVCFSCWATGKKEFEIKPNTKYVYHQIPGFFAPKYSLDPVDVIDS